MSNPVPIRKRNVGCLSIIGGIVCLFILIGVIGAIAESCEDDPAPQIRQTPATTLSPYRQELEACRRAKMRQGLRDYDARLACAGISEETWELIMEWSNL